MEGNPWMWEESQQPEVEGNEDGAECAASQGDDDHDGRGMHRRAASPDEEEREVRGLDQCVASLGDKDQRAAEAISKGAWREHDIELVGGVGKQLDHDGQLLDQYDKLVASIGKRLDDHDGNLVAGNGKNKDGKLLEGASISQDVDLSNPRFGGGSRV